MKKEKYDSILDFNIRILNLALDDKTPLYEKYNFACIICDNIIEFITVRLCKPNCNRKEDLIKKISFIYSILSKLINELIKKIKYSDRYINNIYPYINYLDNNLNILDNININDGKIYYVFATSNNDIKFIESGKTLISINSKYGIEHDIIESYLIAKYGIKKIGTIRFIRGKNYTLQQISKDLDSNLDDVKLLLKRKSNNKWQLIQTDIDNYDFIEEIFKSLHIDYEMNRIIINQYMFNISDYKDAVKSILTHEDYYKPIIPIYSKINFKSKLKNGDLLFYTPYHSYNFITDFISEMCSSNDISFIFITIYRLSANSKIVEYLCNASDNGKHVFVNIELLARGNEKSNIHYINKLKKHGCNVIWAYYSFKIHMKAFCAVSNNGKIYSHFSTGNYNETNAKIYTDFSLITSNKKIGINLLTFFEAILNRKINYTSVIDDTFITNSNLDNREMFVYNINKEKEKGVKGKIYIKCNNIFDEDIINSLYSASLTGVDIRIICRSICGINPIVENLQIRSKLGQLLEHDRLYIFGDSMYISSFDLLPRNLDRRLESFIPIYDSNIRNDLSLIFKSNWNNSNFQLNRNFKWEVI